MSSPDFDSVTIPAPAPSLTVPGYELLGEIARSGLATIYRARDVRLGHDVAIKIHQPSVDPKRLLREAQITVSLGHPGIVPVHRVDQLPDGRGFMAMKLVEGSTLAHLLQGRASLADGRDRLAAVFEQVCQAVAYAHSRGVIHRNLRPSKVMIGALGEVQVLGWGLARVVAEDEVPVESGPQNIVGTAAYMPPEQARGEVADTRSDVFGLGGLLCAVLTGKPVFTGEHAMELLRRSAAGDLAETFARLDACDADPELVALAKRCLSPNPADRPADAAEVARAVTQLRPPAAESPMRPRRRPLILVFLVAAVVLLLINAVLLWSRS